MAGKYICETCFDALTDEVIEKDGLEQAICAGCMGPKPVYTPWTPEPHVVPEYGTVVRFEDCEELENMLINRVLDRAWDRVLRTSEAHLDARCQEVLQAFDIHRAYREESTRTPEDRDEPFYGGPIRPDMPG